jgi:ribosomal-protein-serine acetyltransferase
MQSNNIKRRFLVVSVSILAIHLTIGASSLNNDVNISTLISKKEIGMKTSDFPLTVDQEIRLELVAENHAVLWQEAIDTNRTFLRRFLSWVDTSTLESTHAYFRSTTEGFHQTAQLTVSIFYQNVFVGAIALHNINMQHKHATMVYWMREASQGKGIMTRSCKALIDYAFAVIGLKKIEVHLIPTHERCLALVKRLGFTLEGRLRQRQWLYDHYEDHDVYGVLASER